MDCLGRGVSGRKEDGGVVFSVELCLCLVFGRDEDEEGEEGEDGEGAEAEPGPGGGGVDGLLAIFAGVAVVFDTEGG